MSFRSDVLKVASGVAIAQVITVAVSPVLARLFAPEAFGAAAVFASVTGVVSAFACLCYEQAIVLSSDDGEALNVLALCLSLAGASAGLMGLALWIAFPLIVGWADDAHLSAYLWLLPVAVFLQAILSALNLWNTRTKQFARVSASQVAGQITVSSLNVAGGFADLATGGTMIYSSVIAQGASVAIQSGGVWRHERASMWRSVRLDRMIDQIKRHRNFPLYTSWSALVNAASWQLPVLMLGALFSPAVAGFYALGFRVLQLPMSLIGRSIGQVFLQRAAVEHLEGDLGALVKTLFQKMLVAGTLPCLVLAMVGEELFSVVFGAHWSESGVYVQMLAPWALVWFVSAPLSSLYYVVGRQREEMWIQAAIFGSRVAAVGIAGYLGEARLGVLLFSVFGILTYGYLVRVLFVFVGLETREVLRQSAVPLRDAALLATLVLALKISGVDALPLLGAAVVAVTFYGFKYRGLLRNS